MKSDPQDHVRPPSVSSAIRARLAALQIADGGVSLGGHEEDDTMRVDPGEAARSKNEERYVLRGEIARGGMGAILKVWDADLRRNIAMKLVLDRHLREQPGGRGVDSRVLSRFLDEAQVTGQLDHPGVVPVHELGIEPDGRVYFTMRLVRGVDFEDVILKARAEEDGWNRMRALTSLQRVCETMAYAHSKGVVHRDLKPANVMVGQFGETYVMDWGLAKIVGREDAAAEELRERTATLGLSSILTDRSERERAGTPSPLATQQGSVIGTPYYMPPEQAAGRIDDIGPHSDVYSVGCMLYQLIAGRRPYEEPGDNLDVHTLLAMVMHSPPKPVTEFDRTVPAELVAICEKAMAPDWRDRYPSMLEMAVDLRAYLENRVVSAHSGGLFTGLRKWVKRHKGVSAALAGLLLLAVGSAAGFAWLQQQRVRAIRAEQELTAAAQREAEENLAVANENAERLRRQSYATNVMAADVSLRAGEVREAKRYLAECDADLRGWEWRHLARRADAAAHVLAGHTAAVTCVALDPTGRLAVSGADDGTARVWSTADGALAFPPLAAHDTSVQAVAFSADGQRVTTFGGPAHANMRTWDARTGALVGDKSLADYAAHSIALSPDGERMAFGTADGTIKILAAASGLERGSIEAHPGRLVADLEFAPDGAHLVSGAADGSLALWDLAGSSADDGPVWSAVSPGEPVLSVAFSRNGARVAAGLEGGGIREHDAATGALLREFAAADGDSGGHGGDVEDLAYAADGTLASASIDKTLRLWPAARGEAGEPSVLLGHDRAVRAVAIVGGRIVSGSEDATVRVWRPDGASAVARWTGPDDYVSAVSLARDGTVLAGTAFLGTVALIDGQRAVTVKAVPGTDDPVRAVAFAPGGRAFAWSTEQSPVVRRWDLAQDVELPALAGHATTVTAIAYDPTSDRIATGSKDKTVRVWDPTSRLGAESFGGHADAVQAVAFSRDGSRVASADASGVLIVWDPATGEEIARGGGGDGEALLAVAFDPGGEHVATGGADRIVTVWSAATGERVLTLPGHGHNVSAVAYSPDGTRIASASYDGTVRLWDAESGRALLVLRVDAEVTGLAFGPDGDTIAASAFDNTVRVWRAAPAAPAR